MNDGEKMEEKEITQEKLNSMKKNAIKTISGKKLKVRIETIDREQFVVGFDVVNTTVYSVEDKGVVFMGENGTRFFVLYEDIDVSIRIKRMLGSSTDREIDWQIEVIVQNAVID